MAQTSKADKIRKLLHLPNAVIAERMGCPEAYVRTVRQRTDAEGNAIQSVGDLAWRPEQNARQRARYATDPEYRERCKATTARARKANWDRYLARQRNYAAKRRAEARAS